MKSLVFSSYINAYTICKATESLGIYTATTDMNAKFPITSAYGATKADWLFFTEEASLRCALLGKLKGNFLPNQFPLYLLDNKWEFANWLKDERLAEVPKQWSLSDYNKVSYPCLLKAKHSWNGMTKLPRGWLCNSLEEIKDQITYLQSLKLNSNFFFLQEWIDDSLSNIVSVCGFHDSKKNYRNLTTVVKKIKFNSGFSRKSAKAVETINDDWRLVEKTTRILNKLDFTGPFEIEFIVSKNKKFFLELNPRFWMQHAIFLKNGNGLIKRYLNLDNKQDHLNNKINNIVWIDPIQLISSIIKLKFNFLLFIIKTIFTKQKQLIMFPSFSIAILVLLKIFLGKLKIKFYGLIYSK
jgi:hypothetical protein